MKSKPNSSRDGRPLTVWLFVCLLGGVCLVAGCRAKQFSAEVTVSNISGAEFLQSLESPRFARINSFVPETEGHLYIKQLQDLAATAADHLAVLCYRVETTEFPRQPEAPLFDVIQVQPDESLPAARLAETVRITISVSPPRSGQDAIHAHVVLSNGISVDEKKKADQPADTGSITALAHLDVIVRPSPSFKWYDFPEKTGQKLAEGIYNFLLDVMVEKKTDQKPQGNN